MKYKAEVVAQGKLKYEEYFKNLSHPNQVVRNIAKKMKGVLSYYLIYIVNEVGETWIYSSMKKSPKDIVVRKMDNTGLVFNRDELDMIFSGNMKVYKK